MNKNPLDKLIGLTEALEKENERRLKVGLPPWKIINGKQVHDPDHPLTVEYRKLINKEK